MSLKIKTFTVGPLQNNVALVFDETTKIGVIIDPSFDLKPLVEYIVKNGITIERILITHAHFDHFAGLTFLISNLQNRPQVGLHTLDLDQWNNRGGADQFGVILDQPEKPDLLLTGGEAIELGGEKIEVKHSPGHSPGSLIFYLPSLNTAIVGDVIFYHGIGRTDLPDGNFETLIDSIREQIFSLPASTILIPGHGPNTTVTEEMQNNPFIDI